jgi:hypothetical protein
MAPRQKLVALHPVHGYAIAPPQDLKTMKRNARERNRVLTVNQSFDALRRAVPSALAHRKLSKVNIIQHAMEYIQTLSQLLGQDDLLGSAVSPPSWSSSCSSQLSPCCSASYGLESAACSRTCWPVNAHSWPGQLMGSDVCQYGCLAKPNPTYMAQQNSREFFTKEEELRKVENEDEEVMNAIVDWQTT